MKDLWLPLETGCVGLVVKMKRFDKRMGQLYWGNLLQ